jgi:hypothetical protein
MVNIPLWRKAKTVKLATPAEQTDGNRTIRSVTDQPGTLNTAVLSDRLPRNSPGCWLSLCTLEASRRRARLAFGSNRPLAEPHETPCSICHGGRHESSRSHPGKTFLALALFENDAEIVFGGVLLAGPSANLPIGRFGPTQFIVIHVFGVNFTPECLLTFNYVLLRKV